MKVHRLLARCLLLGLLLAGPARADERDGEEGRVVRGQLRSVDAAVGTLSLQPGEGGRDPEFNLLKEVKVFLDGKPGKLTDLRPGMRVALEVAPLTEDVVSIRVEGPVRRVFLKGVDPDAGTLTLAGEGGEKVVQVGPDARILVEGRPARLADVKGGSRGVVRLSTDEKAVLSLTVGGGEGERDGDAPARPRPRRGLRATVKAVDADRGTLTVTWRGEGAVQEQTFTIGDRTPIWLGDDQRGKLTDLKPGGMVMLGVGDDRQTVVTLAVLRPGAGDGERPRRDGEGDRPRGEGERPDRDRPRTFGVLKAIDPDKGTVTLTVRSGEIETDVTLPLAKDVTVLQGERQGDLSALAPGARVAVKLGPDRKTVTLLQTIGRAREGDERE